MSAAQGKVVSIHRVVTSRGPLERLDYVEVHTDFGIVGDYRSKPDHPRQLTVIDEGTVAALNQFAGQDVPDGVTHRQIVVRGLDLFSYIGKNLQMGTVKVRVELDCRPCDFMNRLMGPGARDVMQNRGGICCRVLEGGTLHEGDVVREVASS